jgi:hypothetical protein
MKTSSIATSLPRSTSFDAPFAGSSNRATGSVPDSGLADSSQPTARQQTAALVIVWFMVLVPNGPLINIL